MAPSAEIEHVLRESPPIHRIFRPVVGAARNTALADYARARAVLAACEAHGQLDADHLYAVDILRFDAAQAEDDKADKMTFALASSGIAWDPVNGYLTYASLDLLVAPPHAPKLGR